MLRRWFCAYRGCLTIGFLFLASMPGLVHGQPLSETPRFDGLALQVRAVSTSEWSGHWIGPASGPPDIDVPPDPTRSTFREPAAYGMGLDAAYVLGHGVAPFVAADFNLQGIHSKWRGFRGYGTVAVGVRVRHPISRRIVPFAQASVARLRLAIPVYTQPFLGGGVEYFIGRRTALRAALDLPVGSTSLDKGPRRFSVGTSWYLGH